ncbi:hypothetical protein vseg_004133 [Gypsophila vaccaria]
MLQSKHEELFKVQVYTVYANESPKSVAQMIVQRSVTFSSSMKRFVRPQFVVLLLIVVAATFGSRVAVRNRFGSVNGDRDVGTGFWAFGSEGSVSLDVPMFNSTLLRLAEADLGEDVLRREIEQLLVGSLNNPVRFRTFATWRRLVSSDDDDGTRGGMRREMGMRHQSPGKNVRLSPEFGSISRAFKSALGDWSRKRGFEPEIMKELVDKVKVPIDEHTSGLAGLKRKYSSCAVVGNSGILLSKEYGELIDGHEAVIRLNNARVAAFRKNVGSKTSMSFINSNILHLCARRDDCSCHPYGTNVPIVMYMCQPAQFLDYVVCNSSHKSPLIVTDPQFDTLCSRIVKYYSLKRFADGGPNKTLEHWNSSHEGSLFHYSSGMQAVTLALGICDQVSLFGFGKSNATKHHYHTNQKKELSLHDYEAEYDYYHDLVKKPRSIPFFPESFNFPPVVIHR